LIKGYTVRIQKKFLPILVMIIAVTVSYGVIVSKSKPQRRAVRSIPTTVEVMALEKSDFQIWVQSQGTVTPRTESTLVPEVPGRVTGIFPAFREGSFFEAGQELLQIDPSDYQIAVIVAQSNVAGKELALAEEQAKVKQAARNWERLGDGGHPSDLVLRKPQLVLARAAVSSAQALLRKAKLDLERTLIRAPYAGRVLEQNADLGQHVSPGTTLARIYAVDYAEVRLPLSGEQLQFIDIPEQFRGQTEQPAVFPQVEFSTTQGRQHNLWQGSIVRAEGAYDTRSRRLSVVGLVDNPYVKTDENVPPLKVGQFVEARIKGKLLQGVFVIPRSALRDNSHLMIVGNKGRLEIRQVELLWRGAEQVVIRDGLKEGEWLSITPVQHAVNGLQVQALHNGQAIVSVSGGRKP
jgi:RND family efflux transporter MFP subunit